LEWPRTHEILDRAVVYGMDIFMDDARIDRMQKAVRAGFKAAL
jgi:8-amino-3,8-dideoxy-alpha-D-manno-octulosonate transaminase